MLRHLLLLLNISITFFPRIAFTSVCVEHISSLLSILRDGFHFDSHFFRPYFPLLPTISNIAFPWLWIFFKTYVGILNYLPLRLYFSLYYYYDLT